MTCRHTLAQLFQLALDAYWKTFIKISARRAVIREIADRAVNFQGAIFYLHFRWSARCGDERETPPRSPSQRQSRNCISRAEIKPQPPRLVVLGRRDKKRNPHTAAVTLKSHIDARECVKNSISNAPPSNKVNPLSPRSPLCVCESGFSNFAHERRGRKMMGKFTCLEKTLWTDSEEDVWWGAIRQFDEINWFPLKTSWLRRGGARKSFQQIQIPLGLRETQFAEKTDSVPLLLLC